MSDLLPRSPEAERALIGSVLERMKLTDRAARVKPEHFSDGVLREIWTVILRMVSEDQPIDLITVSEASKGSKFESEISELLYLLVGSTVPSSMHIDKYASIVESTAAKRKLALSLQKVVKIAMGDGMSDPGAVFAEAIAEIQEAGKGFEFYDRERWTAAELAALEISDAPWMLEGLLIESGLNLIAGEFAAGKTFCALDLAIGAAVGGLAWGRVCKPSKVLYFGADNARPNLVRRVRYLSEGRGIEAPHENLIFDLSPLDLSNTAGMAVIREAIIEHQAELVIVDAVIRYLGDLDENSAADIGRLMAAFRDIANSTGATIVLIHHLRKLSGQLTKTKIADRIRGSGDFLGAVDSAVVLSTKGQGSNIIRNVTHVKCREAEESDPLSFEIHEPDEGGLVLSFGVGSEAMATATIAEMVMGLMIEAMKKEPGVTFTKENLRTEVENKGLTDLSSRSIDRAFSLLRAIPKITVAKAGKFNHYSWSDDER